MRSLIIVFFIFLGGCQTVLRDEEEILYFDLDELEQNGNALFQPIRPCKIEPIGRVFFKRKGKQHSTNFCKTSQIPDGYKSKNWAYLSKVEGMKIQFCKNVILDTEYFNVEGEGSGYFHVQKPINCYDLRNP